jgi:hypothetical protein
MFLRLGQWLAVVDQPAAAVKGKVNRAPYLPSPRGKHGDARTADVPPISKRKTCSWFDLPPGTLQLPRSEEELEIERLDRKFFGNWPGRR